MTRDRQATPLPSVADVRAWLAASGDRPKASAAARAFGVRGVEARRAFKTLYKQALDGETAPDPERGPMPPVTLFRVTGVDQDGALLAEPDKWEGSGAAPVARIHARSGGRLAPGVRLIARTRSDGAGGWTAEPIRVLPEATADGPELCVVEADGRGRFTLKAARPGRERTWKIAGEPPPDLADGDLVLAAPQPGRGGPRGRDFRARIMSTHGRADDPAAFGLALMASLEAPIAFSAEAEAEAAAAEPPVLKGREDLRDLALLTIDGADARDFDDAVYAEPKGTGWRVVVAIADVAWYVRPGSALDREARARGNSTYLPDRAIPMLPEALSNGLCSLKPGEDRACLFAEMTFDKDGKRRSARFGRGLMRSHWRLTYEEAAGGGGDGPADAVSRLYGAFECLERGRAARGPLELELPERTVAFDDAGAAIALGLRPNLTSHRLIEEFMVQANAAAAEALLAKGVDALFRVHDKPDPERIGLLAETAQSLGAAPPGARMDSAGRLNAMLARLDDGPVRAIVSELILRAQARARYGPDCDPHFGLALEAHAHFTSPIRRYADLVAHRALIRAYDLGEGGAVEDIEALEDLAEAINRTERRSATVERATLDRYAALLAVDHVGETLDGRIVGANRVGLFVRFDRPMLEGFAPVSSLPDDFWRLSRDGLAMEGRRSGKAFRLGDAVRATIIQADPATGAVTIDIRADIKTSSRGRPRGKSFTKKRRK